MKMKKCVKKKELKVIISLAVVFVLLGWVSVGHADELLRLKSGSSKSTSSHFVYGQTLASIINKNVKGVNVTNVETGASVDNMKRLNKGDIDIAAVVTLAVGYNSYHGKAYFKNPHPDNRYLMTYWVGPAFMVVRGDSPIYKMTDIDGKKINPGIPGSSNDREFREIVKALNIKPDWYVGSPGDAVKAIKDRRIDGYITYAASMENLNANAIDLKTYTTIRIIPFTEEQKNKAVKACPLTPWTYIKKGQIKEMPDQDGFWTYSCVAGAITNTKVPADAVYRMLKAIFDNVEEMKAGFRFGPGEIRDNFHTWYNFRDDFMPLHAGAVKFYKEQGIDVPNYLIPPEYNK